MSAACSTGRTPAPAWPWSNPSPSTPNPRGTRCLPRPVAPARLVKWPPLAPPGPDRSALAAGCTPSAPAAPPSPPAARPHPELVGATLHPARDNSIDGTLLSPQQHRWNITVVRSAPHNALSVSSAHVLRPPSPSRLACRAPSDLAQQAAKCDPRHILLK